ncbi:DC-STAMP domain-containing protein 2-like [Sipha flava]|uniref:DC-STAMP domain-containing protein 2 n=1 Tax=Sipha flava TaxID=143950 RepID=A0A2S2QUJ9_9HEMI|nr:DC-STAMP domain-containing protein 2-like [Sipha flava]
MVCILCGYKAKEMDLKSGHIVLCTNEGCKGIYCSKCFVDIRNKCTLCSNPLEYGDITDVSEEKDSSDEMQKNFEILRAKRKKPARKTKKRWFARTRSSKSSLGYSRVSSREEGDVESSSGCDSDDTCSSVSNSYENDHNYVNAPLNYAPLVIESQYSIHRVRKSC